MTKLNTRKLSLKKGQKKITHFKSKQEYQDEIKSLENTRYNYYLDYVKSLQLIELEYKSARNNHFYQNIDENKKQTDNKYREKKKHATAEYLEVVRPIDKKLKEMRLEVRRII